MTHVCILCVDLLSVSRRIKFVRLVTSCVAEALLCEIHWDTEAVFPLLYLFRILVCALC